MEDCGSAYDEVTGNLQTTTNHKYCVFLGLEKDGRFMTHVWDCNKPQKNLYFYNDYSNWPSSPWDLLIQGEQNSILIHSITVVDIE